MHVNNYIQFLGCLPKHVVLWLVIIEWFPISAVLKVVDHCPDHAKLFDTTSEFFSCLFCIMHTQGAECGKPFGILGNLCRKVIVTAVNFRIHRCRVAFSEQMLPLQFGQINLGDPAK